MSVLLLAGAVGAGLLALTRGARAADGSNPIPGSSTPSTSLDPVAKAARDGKDAQQATALLGATITLAGTALTAATSGTAAPYVGAAAAVVGTAWASLSTGDKARIWRGELK